MCKAVVFRSKSKELVIPMLTGVPSPAEEGHPDPGLTSPKNQSQSDKNYYGGGIECASSSQLPANPNFADTYCTVDSTRRKYVDTRTQRTTVRRCAVGYRNTSGGVIFTCSLVGLIWRRVIELKSYLVLGFSFLDFETQYYTSQEYIG
jgi:hypothetical protein